MISEEKIFSMVDLAKKAALSAGNFLIKRKSQKGEVHSEVGRDIKLKIDREAESLIRDILKSSNIDIHGEEFGIDAPDAKLKWVVDPLDGTSNYFRDIDKCCVSIGLIEDDQILLGIIYDFNSKEMFCSSKNNGAYLNDKKITVSDISEKSKASLTTGFPASTTIKESEAFLKDLDSWKKIRMFGSAALSCAYVASGRCDCYLEKGVYIWDIAAGISLVQEAGGTAHYEKIGAGRYKVKFSNGIL